MRASRSRRGLSPYKRRVVAALVAGVPALAAAALLERLVPDPAQNALLGNTLFTLAVQAVVFALLLPLAERLLPDDPPDADAFSDASSPDEA